MKMRTLALLIAAAVGLAALPAACGVKVTEKATPAATPTARPSAAASASPTSTGAATPSPSVAPLLSPTPSAEAAARRAAATVAVKAILPEFDAQAEDIFTRSQAPGAAVAVVAGDGAVYVRCFGIREVGKPEKVDKDTVFQLASISKSFTTTMLAALVGEREIGWDDPVEKYWPGFALWDPWVSRHVTFRDLTAHRSGLPEYAGDELEQFGYGRMEILRRLRYLEPVAGFRAAYAYQNALPTAAAEGASRATGESWERLVRSRVLAPLGMDATVLSYRDYLDAPNRSGSHTMVDGTMRAGTPADDDNFAPRGGRELDHRRHGAVPAHAAERGGARRRARGGRQGPGRDPRGDHGDRRRRGRPHRLRTGVGDVRLPRAPRGAARRRFQRRCEPHDQHGTGRRRGYRRAHQRVPGGSCTGGRPDKDAVRPLHGRCAARGLADGGAAAAAGQAEGIDPRPVRASAAATAA